MMFIKRILNNLNWIARPYNISAVHQEELDDLGHKLFNIDNTKCLHCGRSVDKTNLAGWIKQQGILKPFCDLPGCFPNEDLESDIP
jgi:hypothetical protein